MKLEPRVVNDLDAFLEGGIRLKELDPDRFHRILALVRAYVAVYDRDEAPEVFASRRAEIAPRRVKALA